MYLIHSLLPALLFGLAITNPFNCQRNDVSGTSAVQRTVEKNVLTSSDLPPIRIKVADKFDYVGKFDFTLRDIAYGERHVFVDADDKHIKRLFIFQFEGFLPDNDHTYNYDFSNAETIGDFKYRQNTWAYSNQDSAESNPGGEGTLTAEFLRNKGYQLEDELMMSRFVMVPDDARRHEMILFYLENASNTGLSIDQFYDATDEPTPEWVAISEDLTASSRQAFSIED